MTNYKIQIKKIFDEHREIVCPAFPDEKIAFTGKGINHLIYKGNRSRREETRILANIRILPRAVKILRVMPLWQEENSYIKDDVLYRFWCFEAVVEDRRMKVIVRQVGNGKKHFWSVIPAWRKDRYGIVNAKNRNLEGD